MAVTVTFKHQLDDEVLYMWENMIVKGTIKFVQVLINTDGEKIMYSVFRVGKPSQLINQDLLFSTKQELIDSQ